MAWAQATDVEAQLGRSASSGAETNQWGAWLEVVDRRIRRAFTLAGFNLDDEIADDAPLMDNVIDVEVAAVIRKIQNPEWGVTSTTRSIDDASITKRREGSTGDRDPLALTRDELANLIPTGRKRAKAFSILPS